MKDVRIAISIPIKGREELARRVIAYYDTLDIEGVRLFVVPNMSDIDTSELWHELSPPKVFSLNEPLGHKFNEGIDDCCQLDVDGVMIVGSDDLISPAVFIEIRDNLPEYQEIRGVHFFNSETGEMVFERGFMCGAGKYFSRSFLDACDCRPYDEEAERNVDKGPDAWLDGERSVIRAGLRSPLCIDIKTAENMWGWDTVKGYFGLEECDAEDIFAEMNEETPDRWSGL